MSVNAQGEEPSQATGPHAFAQQQQAVSFPSIAQTVQPTSITIQLSKMGVENITVMKTPCESKYCCLENSLQRKCVILDWHAAPPRFWAVETNKNVGARAE